MLTLDDPDRRNALSPAIAAGLADAPTSLAADPDARVLAADADLDTVVQFESGAQAASATTSPQLRAAVQRFR
ncbi:hypothetical protein [Dactylosporangium sp. NPDC049140]|uniref:hypothetical protein n=1 Tax=Dactylosporangium sp. NPDC049140 TaxID=3155647 RepID=UPI0034044815